MNWDRVAFAARRRKAQDDLISTLEPVVARALERKKAGSQTWWRGVVDAAKPLFDHVVQDDGGDPRQASADWARLALDLTKTLTKTKKVEDYSDTLISTWIAGQVLSAATIAAAKQDTEPFELEWVSMHDGKVRHTHRVADGQRIKPGDKFRVGESDMRYPCDTSAPIKEWINCLTDPNTPILTDQGWKPVAQIAVGDQVMTHRGRYREVIRLAPERSYSGEVCCIETARGVLRVTPNHPVLTPEGWVVAGELSSGRVVLAPTLVQDGDLVEGLSLDTVDLGHVTPTALGQYGHGQEQIGLSALDDQEGCDIGQQRLAGSTGHLPPQHHRPLGLLGLRVLVGVTDARDLVQELDHTLVTVGHDHTGAVGELSQGAVGPGLAEGHDALSVDHGGYVRGGDRVHAENVALTVAHYWTEHATDAQLFNFAVEDDESYVAEGVLVHNCRCTVAAVPADTDAASVHDNSLSASHTGPRLTQGAKQMTDTLIPWYGVLAPEGKWSGDRRMFAAGSLSHRDLPLPLTWQKVQSDAHDGSVTVASIDWSEMRDDGMMHAGGQILASEEADEWVGLLAHFSKFGVSVDADNAEAGLVNEDGSPFSFSEDEEAEPYGLMFTSARVCSASSVNIPAFAEAFVTMGRDPDHDYGDQDEDQQMAVVLAMLAGATIEEMSTILAISEKSWDGSASRFTPEQWKRSCILHLDDSDNKSSHKLPIREPDGELSRAAVHAAASRLGQVEAPAAKVNAAKAALRSAYKQLDEDPPEGLALDGDEFARGPGWLTNPEDTKRIHDYWTVPGQPGYEKIAWGTPGDFNRCRVEVGEEIGENSPEKLRFINQICAQWHKDATGFWPGHAPAERAAALEKPEGEQAPAISLVASSSSIAPAAWFKDPQFTKKTPIKITDDGEYLGHLAYWDTCHMNFAGTCVLAPRSQNAYGFFLTGEVMTDEGPVATGPITIATGHAENRLQMGPALAHYDNTGTVVADVAVGEDKFGIWVHGWVRPWATEQQVYELRAAALSGDWRRVPATRPPQMELIAALGVNSPGFPAPRVGIENGVQVSLVASAPAPVAEEEADDKNLTEVAEAIAAAIESREARRAEFNELAEMFEEV